MKVENRYEYWSQEGKVFTKWFKVKEFNTNEQCEAFISKQPKVINKLKNEYRIC